MTVIAPAATTFAPNQPPDTTLLVPIDVIAVAVGPGGGVDAVPTETVIPTSGQDSPETATLPRPPQPFAAPTGRKRGIHLHWAMPDALTRGDAGSAHDQPVKPGNPTSLRLVPDRWLVIRMVHFTNTCNGTMLDSDLQRHTVLPLWTEHAPLPDGTLTTPEGRRYYPSKQLTAIAGGDPAWAATYDAVLDRFAFFDDLQGVMENVAISYLVIGWWSDPANHPLAGITRQATYVKRCTSLGWSAPLPVPIPPAPTPHFPTNVLLHGLLAGIPSSGVGTDMRPDPATIELGLGGTGYAALAAMLAEGTAQERAASERVLAAFASGLLGRIDAPDGLVAIDEDRHASAFVGVSAGTAADPDRIAEGDPFGAEPAPAPAPVTPQLAPAPAPRTGAVRLERRHSHAVLDAVAARRRAASAALTTEPTTPGQVFRDVPTSNPRYFVPSDLGIAIRGARRSRRHGEDSRLTQFGLVPCRLSHDLVTVVGALTEAQLPGRLRVLPNNSALPVECQWLLRESVLVDPTRARERQAWSGATEPPPRPPIYVNRWFQPWVPLWADWELAVRVDDDLRRWVLGPTELQPAATPDALAGERVLAGRTLLHASAGWAFAGQIRAWLDEENRRDAAGQGQVSERDELSLMAAASAAEGIDLLGGSLRGLREALLGLDPQRALITRVDPDGNPFDNLPVERLPQLLAGGAATVRRVRLVDAFGRFLDLPDTVLAKLEVASTHRHPRGAPQVTLSPRFQRPARLNLRFIDPRPADTAPPEEARIDQQNPANALSPIAGWLLPDHVDEALECFDAAGRPLGQLMHDAGTEAVVFETAPGEPGSIGGPPLDPDPGTRHVMGFAAGLVAADAAARNDPAAAVSESALSALLRGIDTTLWTVDPLGAVGTAAVAGLVGRPIAVVRALLTLAVLPDLDELAYPTSPSRTDRAQAYAALAARAFSVRLGELTRTDDGLLAFFADDDYSQARLVAPEIRRFARVSGPLRGQLAALGAGSQATPPVQEIEHPYTSGPTGVRIRARQTIRLTLLMNPGGKVHVTSGVLPRKALALARDWFHEALERLSPSFRVGPVLVEPSGVRMPRVTGLGDHQTFTRRTAPLTWRDDPILASSQSALLPDDPAGLQEGWIRVVPEPPEGQP